MEKKTPENIAVKEHEKEKKKDIVKNQVLDNNKAPNTEKTSKEAETKKRSK